jgi:alcohol oxidase
MVYTRASASDYDTWEVGHENPGWGSKELIPLLKEVNETIRTYIFYTDTRQSPAFPSQIETYTLPTSNFTHGKDGPLKISFPSDKVNIGRQFLEVVGSYDKERSVTDDWNDFETGNGYGVRRALPSTGQKFR